MDRLSFELVALIFTMCVNDLDVPPVYLASLNTYLRRVACSTAELWSRVYFGRLDDLKATLMYLERGRVGPVDLELDLQQVILADEDTSNALARMLTPHLDRVRSLRCTETEGLREVDFAVTREEHGLRDFFELLSPYLMDPAKIHPFKHLGMLSYTRIILPTLPLSIQSLSLESVSLEGLPQFLQGLPSLQVLKLQISDLGGAKIPVGVFVDALRSLNMLRDLALDFTLLGTIVGHFVAPDSIEPPIVLPNLQSLSILHGAHLLLSTLRCPLLKTLTMSTAGRNTCINHIARFLRLHAATIVNIDLPDLQESGLEAASPEAAPLKFPLLESLSGRYRYASSGRFLRMIRATALTDITINAYWHISMDDFLDFFEGASATLRSAEVLYDSKHPVPRPGPDQDTLPTSSRFDMACLETFTSRCRLGDAVIAATATAPQLRSLHLYGLSLEGELEALDASGQSEGGGLAAFCPRIRCPIHLPRLESLTVQEFSLPLTRIVADKLRDFTLYGVVSSIPREIGDGGKYSEASISQACYEILDFLVFHRLTLESMQLFHPVYTYSPWHHGPTSFPHLASLSISPGSALGSMFYAPMLKTLEVRYFPPQVKEHGAWEGWLKATTLVIASAKATSSLWREVVHFRNVSHLQLRIDLDNSVCDELRFLFSLSDPCSIIVPDDELSTWAKRPGSKTWLLPQLESLDLRFALSAESCGLTSGVDLADPYAEGWDDDFEWRPRSSESSYDPEEYDSDSDNWGELDEDEDDGDEAQEAVGAIYCLLYGAEAAAAEGMFALPVDIDSDDPLEHDNPDLNVSLGNLAIGLEEDENDSASESDGESGWLSDYEYESPGDEEDVALKASRIRWNRDTLLPVGFKGTSRGAYGHFLRVLREIIVGRGFASENEVAGIQDITISVGPRVQEDLEPPECVRRWFKKYLRSFRVCAFTEL